MKFVVMGTAGKEYHGAADASRKTLAKLRELNIGLEAVYHTHGDVDFVDIVDAPNPEAMVALSIWYAKQGFGRLHSMPAYDHAVVQSALKKTA